MAIVLNNETSLVFKVTRQPPEFVTPAEPTPYEFKELSDIDDQQGLWLLTPEMHFYRSAPNMIGADPAKVIKMALSKALVPYYPLAGRLRETADGKKLVVECTGEGVLFTEADADVRLDEFSEAQLHPPVPCKDELLFNVPGSDRIVNSPLFLIQVTRLKCGGFVLAWRMNHVMADGTGTMQFLKAVGELARGAQSLSVNPVWRRELLRARDPPRVTWVHREYDQIPDTPLGDDLEHKYFFFGPTETAALRRSLPAHLKSATTFEVVAAIIWRSRTIALQTPPDEEVRVCFFMNTREQFKNPPLPAGYYGNVLAFPNAISTAGMLAQNPVGYAVELLRTVKNNVDEEYMKSLADFMVINGRPHWTLANTFTVSNVSRLKYEFLDFGWGPPVRGGLARAWQGRAPGRGSFFFGSTNGEGKRGILVQIYLPPSAMDRFIKELNGYLTDCSSEHPIVSPRARL
ncbi:hypothetical protein vseg_012714 [Gypsophila vaccaria]